jgi:Family of unknown function (DUF5906)
MNSACVKFIITQADKAALRARGWTGEQIAELTPQDVETILNGQLHEDATAEQAGNSNISSGPLVRFTIFVSKRRLSKHYKQAANGHLETLSGTQFSSGGYYVAEIPASGLTGPAILDAAGQVIDKLKSDQALGTGVPRDGSKTGTIVTKAKHAKGNTTGIVSAAAAIPRSLEYFGWPEIGLLLLDGDDIEGLPDILSELYPPFREVAVLVRPSASASVINPATGKKLKSGEHCYVIINEPELSDACLKALMRLAWVNGHGRLMLSKRGDVLVRGPIDACVGSPERLSYEGETVIDTGIVRLPRTSKAVGGGGMLCARDLVAFADLNAPEAAYEAKIAEAKSDPAFCQRREAAKVAYRGEHVAKAVTRGIPREKAEKAYDASIAAGSVVSGERIWLPLTDEHVLFTPGGKEFTVADIKQDPTKYHRTECADPVEGLDYQTRNPAIIYTNGPQIVIYSRAHGDAYAYAAPFDDEPWEEMLARIPRASTGTGAEAGAGETPPRKKGRTMAELSAMLEAGRKSGKWYMPLVRVLASLIGRGWPNDVIKLVVAPICEGNIDDKALDKLIGKARVKFSKPDEEAEEPNADPDFDLKRLNSKHAVLPIGGKTRVVKFGELSEFPGRETIVMTQTIDDFVALNNKYRHFFLNKKGETETIPMGSYWIGNWKRRQYDGGMAFMPHHDGDVGDRLNLWRGFGIKPVKGDCSKFLDFMLTIVCSGNQEHFDYLVKREATIIQKRIRTEVALGLKTKEEGCGKGFYENSMRRLLGTHAMALSKPEHIIGKFNPHLETLLRLTADEALFVGDPKHRNALFNLITEPTLTIEPKGCGVYDAASYLNTTALSNSDHFLPVSDTSRRFFIPTFSAARMRDFGYFAGLQKELDNGGYEALLHYLQHEVDLTGFNVRDVPQTEGLRQQRD